MPLKKIDYLPFLEACWQEHLAPKPADAPTVISTFAGCGGSSLGYSMAGFRELLAIEWDDNAVETFKLNFPGVPVYHGDIAKISVEQVLEMTGLKPGELDIFDGSPPCQGFSTAGKRQIDDPRNSLFKEYVRLLRGLRPKVFVMENVSGMVKGVMKLVFVEILKELKASGYKVSARLLNAMYFNVPQSRQRMIFIGVRDDLAIEPSHPKAESVPVTVGNALRNIEQDLYAPVKDKQDFVLQFIKQGMSAIQCVPKDVLKKYIPKMVNNKTYVFDGICKRLDESKTCGTLSKVFIPYSNTPVHPTENRFISLRECARIGSFPDGYKFIGDYKTGLSRIGNSVPPLFMRSIARHIRAEILSKPH